MEQLLPMADTLAMISKFPQKRVAYRNLMTMTSIQGNTVAYAVVVNG
jgi:hypothetical protein